ncbi:MAG: carboxypeptidase regulatory-like domain-containing protein [Planctomycetes bacterium]|nr:carboxypeptidase regulatory-like domain-containing protein [Planctomycetota bacterium]
MPPQRANDAITADRRRPLLRTFAGLLAVAAVVLAALAWPHHEAAPPPPVPFTAADLEALVPVPAEDPWLPAADAGPRTGLSPPTDDRLAWRGRVVESLGQPIAGAAVRWTLLDEAGRALRLRTPAHTGADGRFAFAGTAPRHPRLALVVEHPEFAATLCEQRLVGTAIDLDVGDLVLRRGGALRGRIVDADGAPLPGATVSLRPAGGNPLDRLRAWRELLPTLTVDGDGGFQCEHLPAGEYRLEAWAEGRQRGGPAAAIRLDDGAAVDLGAIVLARGHLLTGTVAAPDGSPLRDADVRLRDAPTARQGLRVRAFARTGADGSFRIDHLPACPLRLEVAAAGCLSWAQEPLDPATSGPLRITLAAGIELTGQVVDAATGAPVERFHWAVRAINPDIDELDGPLPAPPNALPAPGSHADGAFTAAGLDTGFYAVEVHSPGYCFARVRPVEVRPGHPAHVVVRLVRGFVLAGTVVEATTGAGVAGARVELRLPPAAPPRATVRIDPGRDPDAADPQGELARYTTTDAAGAFRFADLAPRALWLVASREGFVPSQTSWQLSADATTLRVELTPPATLSGRVDGPAGEQGHAHVLAYGGPGNLRTQRVPLGGEYRFTDLAPGDYLLRAVLGDVRDGLLADIRPRTDALGAPHPADITLRAGEAQVRMLTASPPATGDLAGRVRGENGPWRVTLLPAAGDDARAPRFVGRLFTTTTAADGRFEIPGVPVGTYGIQCVSTGRRNPESGVIRTVTITAGAVSRLEVDL